MEAIGILAIVIILLAVVSMVPSWRDWPMLSIGLLLAGICLLLLRGT